MSTNTPAAPARAAQPPAQQEDNKNARIWNFVQTILMVWLVSNLAQQYFSSKTPKTTTPNPVDPNVPPGTTEPNQVPPDSFTPLWPIGTSMNMTILLSTSLQDPFSETKLPMIEWKDVTLGDWKEDRVRELVLDVPRSVQYNGTLWAHIFLAKDQASPDPYSKNYKPENIAHYPKLLSRFLKKPKIAAAKNLLGSGDGSQAPVEPIQPEGDIWLSYWHPNLTINVISDPQPIPFNKMWPPVMQKYLRVAPYPPNTYLPVIYPNDFWMLREHMMPINTTTPTLPLRIQFYPISTLKFQIYTSMGHGFEEASSKGQGAEMDEFKRVLIETNPWLLIVTAAVSVLHMLFETLAFSSDIAHWRKKNEFTGVSVRTILLNVFVQIITGLYLFDNAQETSWMILGQQVIAVVIEAWKITKAVDVVISPTPAGSLLPYRIEFKDKHVLSETEKKTQEYDALAFRYVSYVAIPTLAAYTVYSLLYETHKGWYSFIITTLSSFVYMFGFVQLVPQLIINYKLKSVAHLPWKTMVYKTLSTVVDDFFAFIIKMPFLHRLASFRDDVVFLILLYQRWIYRVDYSRANEYGQVGEVVEGKGEVKVVEGADKKD